MFNSFHNWVEFGTILDSLRNFWGGVFEPPATPPPLGTPPVQIVDFFYNSVSLSIGFKFLYFSD